VAAGSEWPTTVIRTAVSMKSVKARWKSASSARVTPASRPAGASGVAAALPSKTASIARPRSWLNSVCSDSSTLSGKPAASSFVMAVIEAAFFGFKPSAAMISAPTGMAPPSATKPPDGVGVCTGTRATAPSINA
jgi:hypothetical protein